MSTGRAIGQRTGRRGRRPGRRRTPAGSRSRRTSSGRRRGRGAATASSATTAMPHTGSVATGGARPDAQRRAVVDAGAGRAGAQGDDLGQDRQRHLARRAGADVEAGGRVHGGPLGVVEVEGGHDRLAPLAAGDEPDVRHARRTAASSALPRHARGTPRPRPPAVPGDRGSPAAPGTRRRRRAQPARRRSGDSPTTATAGAGTTARGRSPASPRQAGVDDGQRPRPASVAGRRRPRAGCAAAATRPSRAATGSGPAPSTPRTRRRRTPRSCRRAGPRPRRRAWPTSAARPAPPGRARTAPAAAAARPARASTSGFTSGAPHCDSARSVRAGRPCMASHTWAGVSGMSAWRTPNGSSASITALTTAGRRPHRGRLAHALAPERVVGRRRHRLAQLPRRALHATVGSR